MTGQTLRTNPQMGAQASLAIGEVDATHPALRGVDELRAANFYAFHGRRTRMKPIVS